MPNLPDQILDKLRCFKCYDFLSCGPVEVLSNGESCCGRCATASANTFRAHTYESIALYFLFPCKYWRKHCAYQLNWAEVLEHEERCIFRNTCSIMCSAPGALFKTENKLDLKQNIILILVPDDELHRLLCISCALYVSAPPIFINNEGKNICYRCFQRKGKVPAGFVQHYALEKLLEIMLFPCIYRPRGCTHRLKFGTEPSYHEDQCSYGQVQRKVPKRFVDGNKERGVIATHSGHTFGTITPNSQLFVKPIKAQLNGNNDPVVDPRNDERDAFCKDLIKHRDTLENKWQNKNGEVDQPVLKQVAKPDWKHNFNRPFSYTENVMSGPILKRESSHLEENKLFQQRVTRSSSCSPTNSQHSHAGSIGSNRANPVLLQPQTLYNNQGNHWSNQNNLK